MASFAPIDSPSNEFGWGPTLPPALFTDVPYSSFSKSDKLGKAADWTYNQRWGRQQFKEKDGDEFQVVDTKAQYKAKQFGPRFRGRRRQYEKDTGPEKNSNQRPQRSRRERCQRRRLRRAHLDVHQDHVRAPQRRGRVDAERRRELAHVERALLRIRRDERASD